MELQCKFCGCNDKDYFDLDKQGIGFWCEDCDGYNYVNNGSNNHKFTLILEDSLEGNNINYTSDISFKKHLSPLRYPGGKSKLIEYIYSKLNPNNTDTFVEPFAGGASVGLSLLELGVIDNLVLNDLDFGIYSLFYMIKTILMS